MTKRVFAALVSLCLLMLALPVMAEEQGMDQVVPFVDFEAENLWGGDALTKDIFGEADITLLNYWATWCPPCRAELPDLAQIAAVSEGRVQVVGVLLDAVVGDELARDEDIIDTAIALLEAAGEHFPVAVPDVNLMAVGSMVTAVPTTFLIDGDGNVIGYVEGSRDVNQWIELAAQYYPDAQ